MHKEHETRNFILLSVVILIAGILMLFWGQSNSAQQVFEISFQEMKADELLQNDDRYRFSEEEEALYLEYIGLAKASLDRLDGNKGTYAPQTAEMLYGEAAHLNEIPYTYYDNASDITVILLHGYAENCENSMIFAPYWLEKGYNILIPELRGKIGEVPFTTFGVYEQYDIYDLIQSVCPGDKIILHGRGTGAAAALFLAADYNYNEDISLIVCDTLYENLKKLELDQLKAQFKLGQYFTGIFLDREAFKALGIDVSAVSPVSAAENLSVPAVFVCGENDTFILPDETKAVYDSVPAGSKALVSISGAGSRMAYARDKESYCAAIDKLINNL